MQAVRDAWKRPGHVPVSSAFSQQVLAWFDQHGRKDLPWQHDCDPYSIWISEIMLQQTRVDTVIPYYERFVQRFSDVRQLASAGLDEVLHYWTGLGYYARARNVHKAARQICERHQGRFPENMKEMTALPGIGRTTAAAILALGFHQRHAILDGNVKRVLARYFAVEGWPGESKVEAQLWVHAESLLPDHDIADYTQAMMDIGATLCTRTRPGCLLCPVQKGCMAFGQRRQHELPVSRPSRNLPQRKVQIVLVQNNEGAIWLEKRPPLGVWGGLYSFPEFMDEACLQEWLERQYGADVTKKKTLPVITHIFSHFRLHMYPTLVYVADKPIGVMEDAVGVWYKASSEKIGLAAPVHKTLQQVIPRIKEGPHDAHSSMCKT